MCRLTCACVPGSSALHASQRARRGPGGGGSDGRAAVGAGRRQRRRRTGSIDHGRKGDARVAFVGRQGCGAGHAEGLAVRSNVVEPQPKFGRTPPELGLTRPRVPRTRPRLAPQHQSWREPARNWPVSANSGRHGQAGVWRQTQVRSKPTALDLARRTHLSDPAPEQAEAGPRIRPNLGQIFGPRILPNPSPQLGRSRPKHALPSPNLAEPRPRS